MEHLLTIENLRKDNGSNYSWIKNELPNIDVVRTLVAANQVIDPLLWLIKVEAMVHVSYNKYLELMEYKATENENQKMLRIVQEYKQQMA
ncbi:hypothetical protein M3610_09225 [Neobacillus sp. MER 74]|uniref:hypothetical protein n=1 Tax=Neobacillus sp. MER 74 TaxID=2939566 RepID=UPI002042636A|nr:hypothetical protein [Neobacillus sp. MER 74]MCM3115468.1 hypothetical protein [Neobacillus sp. MER 74]